jgi:hypothetical protein
LRPFASGECFLSFGVDDEGDEPKHGFPPSGLHGLASGVLKERHEPEIHVQLLVTMKQCVARIVSHKIELCFLVSTEHYDVLDDAGRWSSRDAREFETMSVKMERVDIVAGIAKF